jgi:hypothetical protein
MSLFSRPSQKHEKGPEQRRYERAFDKTYAEEMNGTTVFCKGQAFPFERTPEGFAQAAAFLEEHQEPLWVRIRTGMRIF